ncbi:hypothetical protein ACIPWY_31110 [Streptomyces sp. NPDC090032]|uniref:hypothetical protein n=1 Tax=Streptomyces sp. NPDC090032 TaxID=3365925 RepID=UPI00380D4163
MDIGAGRPEVRAFKWAEAEYRQRNDGMPIPASPTLWEPYWVFGRLDDSQSGDYDAFTYEETSALLSAAMNARLAPEQPRLLFLLIPWAKHQRQQAASVPWWKRIFDDSAAGPPSVHVPITDIHPRAVPIWRDPATDTAPVYDKPIQTFADLLALQPMTLPLQAASGGTGAYEAIRGQLMDLAWDWANALRGDFTPQAALNIAIQARDGAIRNGGSKALVGAWNEEIRQLLWLLRRMP